MIEQVLMYFVGAMCGLALLFLCGMFYTVIRFNVMRKKSDELIIKQSVWYHNTKDLV